MPKERDGVWMGGYGSDIWGEHNSAQVHKDDRVNDFFNYTGYATHVTPPPFVP